MFHRELDGTGKYKRQVHQGTERANEETELGTEMYI